MLNSKTRGGCLAVLGVAAALSGCGPGTTTASLEAATASLAPDKSNARNAANPGTNAAAPQAEQATAQMLGPADLTASAALRFADEPAYAAGPGNARDLIIIRDDKIEAYLQKITRNLLAHWKGPKPERIGVFVYASTSINAQARPHGDIFISSAAFNRFKSEDEIALLIGHELGHVLLKHHDDSKSARDMAKIAEVGMMVAVGVAFAKNSSTRKVGGNTEIYLANQGAFVSASGKSLAAALAVKTLSSDVALHAFSREREYAADRFGVQIARLAGYDPSAMSDILDAFRAGEAALEQRKASMPPAIPTSIMGAFTTAFSDLLKPVLNDHPTAVDRDKTMKTFFGSSGWAKLEPVRRRTSEYAAAVNNGRFARMRGLFHSLMEAMDHAQHGRVDQATALMKATERLHKDASPDARLMIYAAYLAQGDANQAYRVLSGASPREKGTVDFYRTLAQDHAARGKFAESRDVLHRGDRDLGSPPGLLPAKINLARLTGDAASIQTHLATCEATKEAGLQKVCRAAATGADLEEEFKTSGGLISALVGGAPASASGGGLSAAAPGALSTVTNTLGAGAGVIGGILGGIFKP